VKASCGRDGPADIGFLAGGGPQVGLIRHRVEHVEGVAVERVDELAVDVVAMWSEGRQARVG
jgi:hypothetical protein